MTTTNMMPVADGTAPGSSLEPLAGLVGGPRVDHLLTAAARRAPDRVALRSATEEISYAALEALTDRCAAMVQGLVDGPGEVVAIAGLMDPEFAPLFFGISRAGNASAVLNPFLPAERLAHVLTTSGARVAVLSPEMYERIAEVRGRAPLLETVVLTRRTEGLDALPTLDELLAAAPGSADPAGVTEDPDALACLQFTSGTTGSAKACRLSHRNLTVNAAQTVYAQQVDESSVVFNCLPTFHLMHLTLAVTAVATHVLWPGADSVASVRAADRLRATHYYSLPVRLSRLAADPLLTGLEAPALRAILSGGSSLPKQAALALAQQFGVPVVQGYGLAETSPSMHLGTPDRPKPGSCGQAVPGGETRIIDVDTREVLPAGAKGEIQVRGPQLMQGYLGQPGSRSRGRPGAGTARGAPTRPTAVPVPPVRRHRCPDPRPARRAEGGERPVPTGRDRPVSPWPASGRSAVRCPVPYRREASRADGSPPAGERKPSPARRRARRSRTTRTAPSSVSRRCPPWSAAEALRAVRGRRAAAGP
ncbi:long-chain fatty acid--CoA ligase [Streptomyces sp. NPDC020766]|uniref:long-chain fatty acid--CoA ligase n=1 Tax=Streptomyces sp. NPDC020766 TaxID=3155011 RepID=UPI0033F138CE